MKNIGTFLSLFLIPIFNLTGQIDVFTNSPDAASLGSYGSVPVGLFTGTALMNIPLFELKTKNLSLPISLNYSSNGLVVDKVASRVGFDWSLFAGGAIVRQIVGLPDDKKGLLPYPGSLSGQALSDFILTYYNMNDFEPDIYSYNFDGYTGTFIFDHQDSVIQVPAGNLHITRNDFSSFNIKVPNGVLYQFGRREDINCHYGSCDLFTSTPSSWFLTKILHPSGDEILFHYSASYYVNYFSGISQTITDRFLSGEPRGGDCPCEMNEIKPIINSVTTFHLDSITAVDNWKVVFEHSDGRNDLVDGYKLDRILQYNAQGEEIKSVWMSYIFPENNSSYPPQSTVFPYVLTGDHTNELKFRMFLKSINIIDKVEKDRLEYEFEYNDLGGLPSRLSYAQDHWGFFNGKYSNNCLIPTSTDQIPEAYSLLRNIISSLNLNGNREANGLYSRKGMLKKITYPTRGYTEIEYESHLINNKEIGGNRVLRTIDNPLDGDPIIKEYQYRNGQNFSLFKYTHEFTVLTEGYGGTILTCNFNTALSNSQYPLFSKSGYHLAYSHVDVSHGVNFENGGETHVFRMGIDAPATPINGHLIIPMRFFNTGWMTGIKFSEHYYKRDGNELLPSKEVFYHYNELEERNSNSIDYLALNRETTRFPYGLLAHTEWEAVLATSDVVPYQIHSKWHPLTRKTTKTYDQNGENPLVQIEDYVYDNPHHMLVSQTSTTLSNGGTSKTKIKYPSDYNRSVGGTNELLTLGYMVDRHMINYPIEIVNYVDDLVVGGKLNIYTMQPTEINLYKEFVLNTLLPLVEDSDFTNTTTFTFSEVVGDDPPQFFMDHHYVLEKEYELYDNNSNLLQFKGRDGIDNAIIWGYNSMLPIASVQNSRYGQVAHTSFENEASKGGWSYIFDSSTINYTDYKTGLNSFQGSNITKSNLITDKYYVSFWAKPSGTNSGIITVNGEDHIISSFDWEFYKIKLLSANAVSINLSGILLDELRLHPTDAQMTTYTHEPLIGLTSRTDFNGISTYYEYDSFGRLSRIRDNHRKLLQEIKYNYQPN
jgi:YD repeat-containing protein